MKLVSIIIPCYNYGGLLAETLESIRTQTYPYWQCLIIDDGSTDNSRAVGEMYAAQDSRFRYFYQNNKGMSAARNSGLDKAQGEYIQFLDADDLLVPTKLERQVMLLEKHPNVDLVYGDVRFFRHLNPSELSQSSDMRDQQWMSKAQGQGESLLNAIIETNIMVVNAPLVKTSLIQRAGRFAEDLRSAEDWEFWIRCILEGGNFHYDDSPEAWALVRVHATSTSQNIYRFQSFVIEVRERLNEMLTKKKLWGAVKINDLALEHSYARLAGYHLSEGNIGVGFKDFFILSQKTGRYWYYIRSAGYHLKMRLSAKKI